MQIAIVTGASSGMGRSTALELARRGMGVILTYARNPDGAASAVEEIKQAGGTAVALRLDLADRESLKAFSSGLKPVLQAIWQRDSFDCLVNNAGIGGAMPFQEVTEAYYEQMLAINFKGPLFLTQQLLPLLADGGRIVNVSSSSSSQTFDGYSVYGSSKAAFTTLSRYLAKELSPRGIRVNSVSPGPTRTDFGDKAFEKYPEFLAPLAAQTALGRIGEAEDIARVIVALLSEDCAWVTGQDLVVSGGFML